MNGCYASKASDEINFWRDLKDRVLEKSPRGFEENPKTVEKTYE